MRPHDPDMWRQSWKRVVGKQWQALAAAFPPSQKRREPFQLLAAAFFYHANGVWELTDDELHDPAVKADATVPWDTSHVKPLFTSRRPPLFHARARVAAARDYFGGMHIASASGRLSVALVLLALHPESGFHSFLRGTDWNRNALLGDLSAAAATGCSANLPAMPPPTSGLGGPLALIVAERDRMAHGDVGSGNRAWQRARTAAFNRVHECRIVEAQLRLLAAAIQDFKDLGG